MTAQLHPRPLLVGVDGTPSGLQALALGRMLSGLAGAPLVLGVVYGIESYDSPGPPWPPRGDARKWLDAALAALDDGEVADTRLMPAATVAHGLALIAEAEGASMIIVGASGRGMLARSLRGTTVHRVVRGAPCAVAVAPRGWRAPEGGRPVTVGVGVIDTDESRAALAVAARLADAGDARLRVLTALQLLPPSHPMLVASGVSCEEWADGQRDGAERLAQGAAASAPAAEVEVLDGDAVDALVVASEELDLLVVGSRRYGLLRSALLGGVSGPLATRARCPLVIVPRGAEARGPLEAVREEAHA